MPSMVKNFAILLIKLETPRYMLPLNVDMNKVWISYCTMGHMEMLRMANLKHLCILQQQREWDGKNSKCMSRSLILKYDNLELQIGLILVMNMNYVFMMTLLNFLACLWFYDSCCTWGAIYHLKLLIGHWWKTVFIWNWQQLQSTRRVSLWCGMQQYHVARQNFEEILQH